MQVPRHPNWRAETVLNQARILLGRVKARRPEKSLLLTGLRGVGKTVLLNEIERLAKAEGYRTISIEAHEDKPLGKLIAPYLRTLLFDLDRIAGAGNKVKRGLAVLRSFIGSLKFTVNDVAIGLDIEPETGAADSGDLEIDLPNLFVAIGEAAEDRKSAVAIFIDEVQYFSQKELGALIMAMHRIQQLQLPLVLSARAFPSSRAWPGNRSRMPSDCSASRTSAPSRRKTPRRALRDPAKAASVDFEPAALEEIYRQTKGYPYFVQEWGYQVWNLAATSPITKQVVLDATATVIPRLDQNFFRVRFDRLTPSEKNFLARWPHSARAPNAPATSPISWESRSPASGPCGPSSSRKG